MELHNFYKGEELFVLGTGPSLRAVPIGVLGMLDKEYTFTTNKLARWEECPFTPSFHGLSEKEDMPLLDSPLYQFGSGTKRFACAWAPVEAEGWQWVAKAPDDIGIWKDGMVGLDADLPPLPTASSTPITLGVQLGVWMGFDPIYLLGCDNTASGQVFDGAETRDHPHPKRTESSVRRCAEDLKAAGRSLIDCTEGGMLNRSGAVPYKPLEDVFGIRAIS
tara:strand:- start:2300 stop:2959 length:660 start_codon:yes stop_codon:yes gene_type:complete